VYSKTRSTLFVLLISATLLIASLLIINIGPAAAQEDHSYVAQTFIDGNGQLINQIVFPDKPPDIDDLSVTTPDPNINMGINIIPEVPAFDWSYGCSPTAAAMLFGWYDRNGFTNIYRGPANGGVAPLDNSLWGDTVYPSVV
jgi:hypothetical protein